MKLYNWDGSDDYDPCAMYDWRLDWLETQISKRHKRGDKINADQYQRWFDEEEKVYKNHLRDYKKIQKLRKQLVIIVPTHFYHVVWLRACLESCQKTGYFTLLSYDNPFFQENQRVENRMPSTRTMMLADGVVMKPKTWGSGVGIPHSWNMWFGLHMAKSLGFKYVFNLNGDGILEKPEGVKQLFKRLKKNKADIVACEYHPGKYLGTMSWLAKMDVAIKLWDMNMERLYQYNFGNAEARMGIFAKQLGLNVLPVKNPEDHHFKPPGTKGTWRQLLGYRHLHAEHKVRRSLHMEPVEQKYFEFGPNNLFLNALEQKTLIPYWKTGDKKYLENWWV